MISFDFQVTDASLRGRLILVFNLLIMSGPLLSYAFGPVLSYHALAAAPLLPAAAALFLALVRGWMLETPFYLVSKNKADKALDNLRALRVGRKDSEVRTRSACGLEGRPARPARVLARVTIAYPPGARARAAPQGVVTGQKNQEKRSKRQEI